MNMNVAWNGIGQNRMESNIAALLAFHLGVRTVVLLCNRDPLCDRCSRQPFGRFSKKLCIVQEYPSVPVALLELVPNGSLERHITPADFDVI